MSELQGVSADLWKHIHEQERINQAMQRDIQMLAAQVRELQEEVIRLKSLR